MSMIFRPNMSVLKAGVSAAGLLLALSPAALANHANDAEPQMVQSPVHEENLAIRVDSRMGAAIQNLFLADQFDAVFGADAGADVLMLARSAYAQSVFEPVWTYDGVDALLEAYASVGMYGVELAEGELDRVSAIADRRFTGNDIADRARADIELTAKYFELVELIGGPLRHEGEAMASLADAPARSELVVLLDRAGRGDVRSTADHVVPQSEQFAALQNELRHYRAIAAAGGWMAIPAAHDALEPGMSDARVPALRQRMIAEGYYNAGTLISRTAEFFLEQTRLREAAEAAAATEGAEQVEIPDLTTAFNAWYITYDDELTEAVEAFQAHHGLEIDGVIGSQTLAAMNESVDSKINRIRAAMDFWREQGDMGERFVWANIPSFTVQGWTDNHAEISMRAIVGLPSRETPVFSDEIEYAVANPRWYAPVSIVSRDKLPHMREDPGYAARNGYTIIDRHTGEAVAAETVDWYASDAGSRYQFIQAPGDNNALGPLKIIFPNEHSVYLHGTPSMYLFERAQRAFSSGCVRLEDPIAMAMWIAGGEDQPAALSLREALDAEELRRVDFATHTPVHITYVTVTVDEEGSVNFWRDVYHHENSIMMEETYAPLWEPVEAPTGDVASLDLASYYGGSPGGGSR